MSEIVPTNITAKRESAVLVIEWSNGENCSYPFELLRNACPCAQCRGGHENMKPEPDEEVFLIPLMDAKASRMKSLEGVGNYALNIEWEDGHKYGIYNWYFLRSLCLAMKEQV